MATELLYMQDFDVTDCRASVKDIMRLDDGRQAIILDQTCFYPRGGGQDWDTGTIGKDTIVEVRLDEQDTVLHVCSEQPSSKLGDQVTCQVDTQRRQINTRLHSAGHVVDMAVSRLGYDWIPGRGAHYPHMSFVEYETSEVTAEAQGQIQATIDQILQENITNTMQFVSKDQLAELCRHVPANLPSNKPIRVVLYDNFGVPCGGTHVKNLQDIGKIEITKVKSKKGLTKISYRVEGINL